MFYPNPLTLAQRSVLPLALLCALGGPNANAATAGMCHYLTNTRIQNVTGYDLELWSQSGYEGGFNIYPALPTTSYHLSVGSKPWLQSISADFLQRQIKPLTAAGSTANPVILKTDSG